MDEFGVLVQSIGFKAHVKSAPMAKLKPKPNSHFSSNSGINTSSFNDSSSLPVDELDVIFRSNVNINKTTRQSQNFFADDDVFVGPVLGSNQYGGIDLESVLNSSNKRKDKSNLNSMNSVGSNAYDDLIGSKSKPSHPVDDLFGSFGVSSIGKVEKKGSGFDDLIPGFGGANSANKGKTSKTNHSSELNSHPSKSGSIADDDPFLIFESSVSKSDNSWSFTSSQEQDSGKGSVQSSFDAFDDVSMGWTQNVSRTDDTRTTTKRSSAGKSSNGFENTDFLDHIFSGVQQNTAAGSTSTAQDSLFNAFFPEENVPAVKQTSSWSSSSTHMASSSTSIGGDFTSLFGDVITSSGEFHEIEGEPAERRRARLSRYLRMKERIAKALNDKNQRDFQSQYEQEEKLRLAETLDNDIRRWAAGKESNLRALLSSLQQVLGPECGWRPVSLTDMITSDSVKKVYKKAALYVHPDKVQQRGADIQQKYVAEKVFDLLKEAWNKFCAEELR